MTPTTLSGLFRRTAAAHPHRTALEVGGERLDYAGLDAAAARLATVLTEHLGGRRPRAVGLLRSRDLTAFAGYLAALRLGATVVPLDPRAPVERNREIARLAGVDIVLEDPVANQRIGPVRVAPGPQWWHRDTGPVVAAAPEDPDAVAYLLFTSGSTGRPKGVPIRHRNVVGYLTDCARRFAVAPGDRLSQTFELTFDPSVFDMFVAWAGGATLVVPTRDDVLVPARFVAEHELTHWFSVPSVIALASRLGGLRPGSMPSLRWSLFAGEQLTLDQARGWAAAAPHSTVVNLYGPTELTVTCTGYELPRDPGHWPRTTNGTVPIGRPHPRLEIRLHGPDPADGGAGELCVRGPQRFDGYLDPADDLGRFLAPDGTPAPGSPTSSRDWYRTGDRVRGDGGALVHLGRCDDQVKISGYRIEPAEVEAVLREHPDVHDAVVVAVPGRGRRSEIGLEAHYTGAVAESELLGHLRHRLPPHMVPSRLHPLDELPLTANGKVDRRRLRAPSGTGMGTA